MNRYKSIKQFKNRLGTRYYGSTIYPNVPESLNDIYVETEYGDRVDILAHQFYKDPSLWWVIVASNPGKLRRDSYFCKPGMQIRIPLDPEPVINAFNRLNSNR